MSIFVPQPTIPPSSQQLLQEAINQKIQYNNAVLLSLVAFAQQIYANIWNDPNYTPQQIFDAYGTDSASLLNFYSQVVALINTYNNTFNLPSAPFNVTVNPDNTVTVGASVAKPPQGAQL